MLTDLPDSRPGRRVSRPWLALGVTAAGLGMIPWLVYLAVSLPASPTAWHWRAAWVGLDGMEAAGLVSTGILLLRRDARACLTAAATAALLLADAWFDVTTAPPGAGALTSLLMAMLAELPAAALCAGLALRGLRRPPARPVPAGGECAASARRLARSGEGAGDAPVSRERVGSGGRPASRTMIEP